MRTSTTFKKGHIGYKPWLGKERDLETKKKISEKLKGNKVAFKNGQFIRAVGNRNNKWLGEKVGYYGIHNWLSKYFGQPKLCEQCGENDINKRYEWALRKNAKYERKRKNFIRLCKKCHNYLDGVSIELQNRRNMYA